MKKNMMMVVVWLLSICLLVPMTSAVHAAESVELILDWVPNTNHTGLYVAQEKGYFTQAGVDVTIRRPPEGSTSELVGLGKAQFGISFQDSLAHRFVGGLPVTAVAAIIEHNTSGVFSKAELDITSPEQLQNYRYGTWNDPTELAMLQYVVEQNGGDFSTIELIPNQEDNSVIGLANDMYDAAWIYYAWDGIMSEYQGIDTNFFYFKDYAEELDYYSPVIIANNDYLSENAEQAREIIQAIKKGYQYAIENPEEAADILIANAPELEDQRDFIVASQKWISQQYATDSEQWGVFDENRWNLFYEWLVDHELVDKALLEGTYFTNDYVQ